MATVGSGGSLVTTGNISNDTILNEDINSAAAIAISKIANAPYAQLAAVTQSSTTTTFASGTFAAKRHLRVLLYLTGTSTQELLINFNGDAGANYGYSVYVDNGVPSTNASNNFGTLTYANITGAGFYTIDIFNDVATAKYWQSRGHSTMAYHEGIGEWRNTAAAITSIVFSMTVSGNINSGSKMVVLGMD